ncbi:hypothetical protein GNZ12_26975 [Paraburkholderia sp. 1N]|uniref:Uncharacterized protein n=1 Tax=Paraburkholderia solitsugae TaxID=2675748 RepID=A0ABX2BYL9_9BURK|nr:hypothetical protein [Paraburkholderia solitsugae]NPT44895.1 hypothetical protein [Paraburkholderia solitsugae]
MSNTVQSRIYQALTELIPNLGKTSSRTHFAPPRVAGDMAVHCTVDETREGHLTVEIAHDRPARGSANPASWICFDVDPARAVARVTCFQEGCHYSIAGQHTDAQSARVNLYAANWLAVFNTLGRVFEPIDQAIYA